MRPFVFLSIFHSAKLGIKKAMGSGWTSFEIKTENGIFATLLPEAGATW